MITEAEIEKALDYLRDNGVSAAQAKANRVYVEEYRKTIKAQIMKEHVDQALGAQEREAYADPRYEAHLKAIKEAVYEDEYRKWMMAAAEAKISAWQTQCRMNRP